MKAVIEFLDKRIKVSDKAGKIIGWVFSVLFAVSVALFGYLSLKMDIAVCAALFIIICVPFLVFKYYRLVYNNTVLLHLVCIAIGVYVGTLNNRAFLFESEQLEVGSFASSAISFLCFFETVSGIVMNFSGNATHIDFFPKALLYSVPIFFITGVYIPSETYFNNFNNYAYIYSDFFPFIIIRMTILVFVSAVFLCGLGENMKAAVAKLLCGLTLAVYAQYMLMNGSMPNVLGDPMDWDALTGECIVNAVVWLLIIALPFIAGAIIKRIPKLKDNIHAKNAYNYVSLFVGGIHLITLITLIITTPVDLFDYNRTGLSNEEQFVVSKNKNIITFIIDMADQDYFEKAYSTNPEKFECLKDFKCYTNACMMYDSTFLSIPQMLTGSDIYPENFESQKWKSDVWNSERSTAFYSRLHENGYSVNFYGDFSNDYAELIGKADNTIRIEKKDINIYKPLLYGTIDMAAEFKFMPLALKRYFEEDMSFYWNDGVSVPERCVTHNGVFMDSLDLKISESDNNYFIVEHILGTHGYTGAIDDETLACLDIVDKYMSQLKEFGVYDDSVIIITADHGEHNKDANYPIFYMKEPGETHSDILYNASPVWFTDLPATFLKASGLWKDGDENIFGIPIQEIPEDEVRERLVFQRVEYEVGENGYLSPEPGTMYGYYFTGDKYDLAEREHKAPPDISIKINIFDLA